jgi:hypothetical protein
MSDRKISDPKIFGPGMWYLYHVKARDANTEQKKKEFVKDMIYLSNNLPCIECRNHCQQYIKNNPIENYWNIKENSIDISMFKWLWTFHNAVNVRLKKPIIDWNTAKNMYYDDSEVCSSQCGEAEIIETKTNNPTITFNNNVRTIVGVNINNINISDNLNKQVLENLISSSKKDSKFKNL